MSCRTGPYRRSKRSASGETPKLEHVDSTWRVADHEAGGAVLIMGMGAASIRCARCQMPEMGDRFEAVNAACRATGSGGLPCLCLCAVFEVQDHEHSISSESAYLVTDVMFGIASK